MNFYHHHHQPMTKTKQKLFIFPEKWKKSATMHTWTNINWPETNLGSLTVSTHTFVMASIETIINREKKSRKEGKEEVVVLVELTIERPLEEEHEDEHDVDDNSKCQWMSASASFFFLFLFLLLLSLSASSFSLFDLLLQMSPLLKCVLLLQEDQEMDTHRQWREGNLWKRTIVGQDTLHTHTIHH